MLLLLADSTLLIFIAINLGILVRDLLSRLFRTKIESDLFGIFMLGLMGSVFYFDLVSFWWPVNYLCLIPLLLLVIVRIFMNKEAVLPVWHYAGDRICYFFSGPRLPVTVCVVATILAFAIIPPSHPASIGYHYLSILWYEKYRVVPGLVNLHGRFAFNPVSFIIQSAYSFTDPLGQSIFPFNRVLTGLFFLWLLSRLFRRMNTPAGWVHFIGIIMLYRPLLMNVPTPASDSMEVICICYASIRLLDSVLSLQTRLSYVLVPSLLILFGIIIKLSSFPALLLLPFIFFLLPRSERKISVILIASVITLLLYIPWLIRNYIMSGYLVFPFPYADFFHPDWKAPLNLAKFEFFNIHKGVGLQYGEKGLVSLYGNDDPWHSSVPQVQLLYDWLFWSLKTHTILNPLTLLAGIFSPAGWILYYIRGRKIPVRPFFMWLIIYIGAWSCFIVSVEVRFWIAPFTLSFLFPLYILIYDCSGQRPVLYRKILCLGFMLSSVYYIHNALTKKTTYRFTLAQCWLYPMKEDLLLRHETAFPYKTFPNGTKLYLEDSAHACINIGMPCRVMDYGEIEMRGDKLDQGFRIPKDNMELHYSDYLK